jgi:3-isopropylmalate/(R)-2-methylmalate dehydratase large subunit
MPTRLRVDCRRAVADGGAPRRPGLGLPLASPWTRRPVRIDIAYGGSCTAGKREDFEQYHAVLVLGRAARAARGAGVTLYLQFGTQDVRDHCQQQGWLEAFAAVGASCCSRPAAPAPTAGRARPRRPTR